MLQGISIRVNLIYDEREKLIRYLWNVCGAKGQFENFAFGKSIH